MKPSTASSSSVRSWSGGSEGGAPPEATAEGATQFFEGARLVHLRDGKVLSDYGLTHESVVYLVIEGR